MNIGRTSILPIMNIGRTSILPDYEFVNIVNHVYTMEVVKMCAKVCNAHHS